VGTHKIYAEGSLRGLTTNIGFTSISTRVPLMGVASWGGTTFYFHGLIDEVRIYNRALSDEEIKALYEVTK